MPHLQLTMELGSRDPAPYEELLFALGAVSVTLVDAGDDPVLEPAPGETPLWPTVVLKALFEHGAEPDAIVSAIGRTLPGPPLHRFEIVDDQVWERVWLKDFGPMRFGQRLWVCPGGQAAGGFDAVRVELDPGLAFGTGTHPSTALCLEWLDAQPLAGREVVDYGCGSGILAIAAARLGATHVHAVDIDPQAVLATRENAVRNAVIDRLNISTEPRLEPQCADVLVANILAGPLVELAPRFAAAVRPHGPIALSGVLAEQADAVTAAYRPCFDIDTIETRDGWALLGGRRRTD